TVAVYVVPAARAEPADNANVAMRPALSSVAVPEGFTQGAAQVTVKLAALMEAIGSLNPAVMIVLLTATPVALLPGATAVTVGGAGGASNPRIGSRPLPPPPQA